VALVRLEQLYPWPEAELAETLSLYKGNVVVWAQEEPRNMGAWSHVRDNWNPDWGYLRLASRPASSSPAVGSLARHTQEHKALIDDIFGENFSMLPKRKNRRLGEPE
jgi:2-oxoglutarate dehydrogenase E1 component